MSKYNKLSDSEILSVVKDYIEESIYTYAVLIDGDWGSGKSYFIKEYLIPNIKDEREVIYISLYGIKSTEDISNQIYINLLNIKEEGKKIVQAGVKVFADILRSKGIDIQKYKDDVASFIDLSKYILVFDDLERCNCDINEVLGYINNFVEHDGVKVILVANEKEIGKSYECRNLELRYLLASKENINFEDIVDKSTQQDNLEIPVGNDKLEKQSNDEKVISINDIKRRSKIIFAENAIYEKIKEKLIGITIKYEPNLEEIQKKLIDKYVDDIKLKYYLETSIQNNIKYSYEKDHINLRTYQFFLSRIINIYNKIKDVSNINYDEVIFSIIKYCYKVCIDYKSGKYKYEWNDNDKYIYNRMNYNSNSEYEFKYRFIDDYVISSKLDKDELINTIKLSLKEKEEYENNPTDALYELEQWWELEDKKVVELMEKCISNLREDKYTRERYGNVLIVFFKLYIIGFEDNYLETVIRILEEKTNINDIEILEEKININDIEMLKESISFSNNEIVSKYRKIIKEIKNNVHKRYIYEFENEINNCIEDIDNWGKNLRNYKYSKKQSVKKSFMEVIEIDKLKNLINKSNSKNIANFRYAISELYISSNISTVYKEDKAKIHLLIEYLDTIDMDSFDNIKKINIRLLKKLLEEKYELFK